MSIQVDTLLRLPPSKRKAFIESLSEEEAELLIYDWKFWARQEQLPPPGDWLMWVLLGGRGSGKTRAGAEWAKERGLVAPERRIALVAETFADGRDTMVEGESGMLSVLRPHELRGGNKDNAWNRSLGELFLANGTKYKIYSSEKPGQLRGPQHHDAWGDETAKWKDAHKGFTEDTTMSNLLFGLRLGDKPRVCLTTTPKRVRLLIGSKEQPGILKQATTTVVKMTTFDNLANLSDFYRQVIIPKYEGTRLGRQELHAELLEDVEGALWSLAGIDRDRETRPPLELDLVEIVVAVDPATSGKERTEETDVSEWSEIGIVVAGRTSARRRAYILADRSIESTSPERWARRVVAGYDDWEADMVVGEGNQGGDLVRAMVHNVRRDIPVKIVYASRGKRTRAEPVAQLYEQHRIHHVGIFPELEDEMTSWVPGDDDSPDRMDAMVWAISELMLSEGEAGARGKVRDTRLRGRR